MGVATIFDQTSDDFLAIDAGVYALVLVQLALVLQALLYPLFNLVRAYQQKPAKYPLFLK